MTSRDICDYGIMNNSQRMRMLSIEKFDNGAIFDGSVVLPSFKGKWFCNKDMIFERYQKNKTYKLLQYASNRLKNDKVFIMKLFAKYKEILDFIGLELRNDKDICLIMMGIDGWHSKLTIGDVLRDDLDFALEVYSNKYAFTPNPHTIEQFSNRIHNNKPLFLQIIPVNPKLFMYAGFYIRNDVDCFMIVLDGFIKLYLTGIEKLEIAGFGAYRHGEYDITLYGRELDRYWACVENDVIQNISMLMRVILISQTQISFSIAARNNALCESRDLVAFAVEHCVNAYVDILSVEMCNDPKIIFLLFERRNLAGFARYLDVFEELKLTRFYIAGYSLYSMKVCMRLA